MPEPDDLFGVPEPAAPPEPDTNRPLADRLRPATLSEVVGQDHLLGSDGALTRMLERGSLASLILWGPPGVGKTTIARLLAGQARLVFVQLSAVFSGVADLKRAFDDATKRRRAGQGTLLFVDEIHRFNRAQQDGFLPVVENGTVTLIGATTENPSFALNGALLSRCQVMVLRRLDDTALQRLLARSEEEIHRPLPLTDDARRTLRAMADGDGRYLLNMIEQIIALPANTPAMDIAALSELLSRRAALYDKDREEHNNLSDPAFHGEGTSQINGLLSAFHKSLRGSDPQAALYYGARMMLYGPEMAVTVFRRLACAASEDVGMADPQALVQVLTAWQTFERVGWPEGRLFIAHAITYVSTAPKSNASYLGFDAALAAAEKTKSLMPPLNVLNAPTKLMKQLGYHEGYRYDHDEPDAFAGQEFFPEPLVGQARPQFYVPNERGYEREIKKRMAWWDRKRADR